MGDKHCTRCGQAKGHGEFYANARWRDGLHPYCKTCFNDYQRFRRLARLDAQNPTRRRWTRWSIHHDFFREIDAPLKAYILGLLAADGNVLERTPRVTLELAVRDIELVELFRDAVAPGVRIRRRAARGWSAEQAVVSLTSRELVDDLAQWGVRPRKTHYYEWPSLLPCDMQRPYLLGHFDGDGFITISRLYRERPYPRWGLLGTEAFLTGAMAFIAAAIGINRRVPQANNGVHALNITGRDAITLDAWLRDGLAFGLARKRISTLLNPSE